jgi:hypothetical protein
MQGQALGFGQPDHLLTGRITRPQGGSDWTLERDVAFYDALLHELGALPGVTAVGLTSGVPLAYGNTGMSIGPEARRRGPRARGHAGVVARRVARLLPDAGRAGAQGPSLRPRGRHDATKRVVLSSGLKVCGAGIAAGALGALGLGQLLAGLLYGVTPRDLPTLLTTCAALVAVAGLACWLPARRATRIDPTRVLRGD